LATASLAADRGYSAVLDETDFADFAGLAGAAISFNIS
jgi:hypothetical protein